LTFQDFDLPALGVYGAKNRQLSDIQSLFMEIIRINDDNWNGILFPKAVAGWAVLDYIIYSVRQNFGSVEVFYGRVSVNRK